MSAKLQRDPYWAWLDDAEAALRDELTNERPTYKVDESSWSDRAMANFSGWCASHGYEHPDVKARRFGAITRSWLRLYILENDPTDYSSIRWEQYEKMRVEETARIYGRFKSEEAIDRFAGWVSNHFRAIITVHGEFGVHSVMGDWKKLYEFMYT